MPKKRAIHVYRVRLTAAQQREDRAKLAWWKSAVADDETTLGLEEWVEEQEGIATERGPHEGGHVEHDLPRDYWTSKRHYER